MPVSHEARQDVVIANIRTERNRQDRKWGIQSHDAATWITILGEEFGEACQAVMACKFDRNRREERRDELRKELVQTAAVAVAFIEYLDRIAETGAYP